MKKTIITISREFGSGGRKYCQITSLDSRAIGIDKCVSIIIEIVS